MGTDYIRRCPSCEAVNAPEVMRCACGALLAGVDLVSRASEPVIAVAQDGVPPPTAPPVAAAPVVCPFEDCAQTNPPGSTRCVYCDRPFNDSASLSTPGPSQSLVSLPAALGAHYRILRPLPTQGAEAELLLVQAHRGGPTRVAKIYRYGIAPKADVQARLSRIDLRHRVEVLEFGSSDGHAYELMEYCVHGSLRQRMLAGALPQALLQDVVRELSSALAAVHAVGLIHRDLKPENILLRSAVPLDLVLTDFGISSVLEATQRFTGAARTLPYAAPESLSGVIDGKADYWALGMVVLEGLLGQHPFAGLSEAVILHHLTTRNMDLTGVTDASFRKLLRGLLLRDPQQRWGAGEIIRWLANDPALVEPAEHTVGVSFSEPYHLGKDICFTKEQLAVALARNWHAGVSDISNGLLLNWFRAAQKDQNVERLLLELLYDQQLTVDLQLLQLILHLAPGIPPVWRGESIELPAILAHANLALKGSAEAAQWLHHLYQHRVLQAYALAGNPAAANIQQRWGAACDQFVQSWHAGHALIKGKAPKRGPDEFVDFDQAVYGHDEPDCPSISSMHARLLAIAFDAQWSERLRKRLNAELAGLMVYCPWFAELGDTNGMSAAGLLVLESLLPEARKVADRQIKANARQQEAQASDFQTTKQELSTTIHAIRAAAKRNLLLQSSASDELRAELDHYFEVLARIKASGRSDLGWQDLKKSASRVERVALQLTSLLDALAERRAVNAGWFRAEVVVFAILAMLFLPILFGRVFNYWPMAVTVAVVAWRVLPLLTMARRIRALADRV